MKAKSIAVLPFINLSSDPENEYFSDGITEEIINALTKIQGLNVIARTSSFAFKNRNEDVRGIGAQLGAAVVLEGSVRKANDRLRITAQLIVAETGFHIWSENFDRELKDIFALQDEISLLIADKVRENFGHLELPDHLVKAREIPAEIYDLYLKGRHYLNTLNKNNIFKGIELLEEVTGRQPDFALAWAGVHYGYNMLAAAGFMHAGPALEKGLAFLTRAIEIDPTLPDCYHSLGWHSLNYSWDFVNAKKSLVKAIELSPAYADAYQKLFITLALEGKKEVAWPFLQTALKLDPLSPLNHYFKGYYFYLQQQHSVADSAFEKCLELAPHFQFGYSMYGLNLLAQGKADVLLKKAEEISDNESPNLEKSILTTMAYCSLKDIKKAAPGLKQLEKELEGEDSERVRFFLIHMRVLLNNNEEAIDLAAQGVARREPLMTLLREDPLLKPLHGSEKFQGLMQQIYALSDEKIPLFTGSQVQPMADDELGFYKQQLEKLLATHVLYLDPSLSLRGLAEHLGLHPNKLSWLLNEYIGQNFNEYVNSFRLAEFQRKALDPSKNHLTLLGLAYESGFNSKTVFNTFFKKKFGMPPRTWVKSQKLNF